jgi:hypothetical protein
MPTSTEKPNGLISPPLILAMEGVHVQQTERGWRGEVWWYEVCGRAIFPFLSQNLPCNTFENSLFACAGNSLIESTGQLATKN